MQNLSKIDIKFKYRFADIFGLVPRKYWAEFKVAIEQRCELKFKQFTTQSNAYDRIEQGSNKTVPLIILEEAAKLVNLYRSRSGHVGSQITPSHFLRPTRKESVVIKESAV